MSVVLFILAFVLLGGCGDGERVLLAAGLVVSMSAVWPVGVAIWPQSAGPGITRISSSAWMFAVILSLVAMYGVLVVVL